MEDIVIIGGGVAGLSCLNFFLDQHISPLLLEGGEIGSPKMCGEFIAPPIIPILKQFNIEPIVPIHQIHWMSSKKQFEVSLPNPAGGCSRQQAEIALAERARLLKGRIHECSKIEHIVPAKKGHPFQLFLKNGEVIEAKTIIGAAGKFFNQSRGKSMYKGFKAHIPVIHEPHTLNMFAFEGGYFGLVPINATWSNLTCIVSQKAFNYFGSMQGIINHCVQQGMINKPLASFNWNQITWLEGHAPAFGLKQTPTWKQAFWIGDTIVHLPPSIGYGFAHSVLSAYDIVEYLTGKTNQHRHSLHLKLAISYGLHYLLQKPSLCNLVAQKNKMPQISQWLLKQLDYVK